jgi:hypothetical protein
MKLWHAWARKMYAAGSTRTEIGIALHKSRQNVHYALTAQPARSGPRKYSSKDLRARSARMKELWTDPDFRAGHSARMKSLHADPKFCAKIRRAASERMKAVHASAKIQRMAGTAIQ